MLNTPEVMAYMGRRGLSRQALARELGISPPTLRKKLNTGGFTLLEAAALADILRVPPEKVVAVFLQKKCRQMTLDANPNEKGGRP